MADFPFAAVSGQAEFKLALILAAINPTIGGVLISGPRGCAKSTLARSIVDLLPNEQGNFVTLPLGASEEMLLGSLNLDKVLNQKEIDFSPGLLAKAHNGVLYVDEVNLLPDNLVDQLLDVAASGVNRIERDGISHSHESAFLLVGTMNPDEGDIRPQLQDRFGLSVELDNQYTLEERIDIVKRREAFDADASAFIDNFAAEQVALRQHIADAKRTLAIVTCDDAMRRVVAERCQQASVEGLRADIVWAKAAIAHAAFMQNSTVQLSDIDAVEELVLCHRRKAGASGDNQQPPSGSGDSKTSSNSPPPQQQPPFKRPENTRDSQQRSSAAGDENSKTGQQRGTGEWGSLPPQFQPAADDEISLTPVANASNSNGALKSGINSAARTGKKRGVSQGVARETSRHTNRPQWFNTIVANLGEWPPKVLKWQKQRDGRAALHLVLLDTSASTLNNRLFAQAKAAVVEIGKDAYLAREDIAILGFGNQQVNTILPRVKAPKQLRSLLDDVPAFGGTPLRDGLLNAQQHLQKLQRQYPNMAFFNYVISDGRSSQQVADIKLLGDTVFIDIEASSVKRGRGASIAKALGARYFSLASLATPNSMAVA